MAATTTDQPPTDLPPADLHDVHATEASAGAGAPLSSGLATGTTLSAVLGLFLPLFGLIAASLVARRARADGFSTRAPDLVMFWVAILMYVETLWLFWQLFSLLGPH